MTINLNIRKKAWRIILLAATLIINGLLAEIALKHFAYAALTDPKLPVSGEMLNMAAGYFPNSARVQARLAAHLLESGIDSTQSHDDVAAQAVRLASRAVMLSPKNYEVHMISGLAKEAAGDLASAEAEMRIAVGLAPNHLRLRWRLANLLVRAGKLEQAVSECRFVNTGTQEYLPEMMDLIWQASDGNVAMMRSAIGEAQAGKLALARFFIQQGHFEEGAALFRSLPLQSDARMALDSPVTHGLLDDLIQAGQIELASQLWSETIRPDARSQRPLIWNGGFETTIKKGLAQFDWNLSQSKYARVSLVTNVFHTGHRSLEIAYLGVDTTRLENEVRQLVVVRPGQRYRLQAYAKTEDLVASDSLQLAVLSADSKQVLATSGPVTTGSHDWQLLTAEFIAPPSSNAIIVAITQQPRFSYVEPPQGTVWFDDFALQQN